MARHTILIALLVALTLVVVHTYASREGQESCREQLKKVNLRPCEKHIMKRIEKEEEDVLTMRGISYNRRRESEEDQKEKCCEQLGDLDSSECKCKALQKIMDRKGEKLESREVQDMERELRILPLRCGLGPLLGCELSYDED